MDSYDTYKRDLTVPSANRSWLLRGAGMEALCLEDEDMPEPGSDEILARVDAVSICFSDVKLIRAGNKHPRVLIPLEERPTVPGHEVSLTIVKAGAAVSDSLRPGERYIIQADIFKADGAIDTFGYTQRGGMALYVILNSTALDGRDGCYLLPVKAATGFSEAALVEPWACVVAAYHIPRTAGINPESRVFVHPEVDLDLKGTGTVTGADAAPDRLLLPASISDEEYRLLETGAADGAIIAFVDPQEGETIPIDAGAVHYRDLKILSASAEKIREQIDAADRKDLRAGGLALFAGAGGPMGQMHIQRACTMPDHPARIAVTDISDERLAFIRAQYAPLAAARGIIFEVFNAGVPAEELRQALLAFAPGGFDDIILLAPVAPLVTESQYLAADGCLINIFAGIPIGNSFNFDPAVAADKQLRFTGSSGSSMGDIARALEMVENETIRSDGITRAIGGLEALKEGVQAVADGGYPGKVVIYPQLEELPLLAVEDIAGKYPALAGSIESGTWNREAERGLFNVILGAGSDG